MKYKHKRICKSLISLLLIITFILAPFEGVFAEFNESSTYETGAGGRLSDGNGDGIKPLKNLAVTIGILEIDNTAQEYRSQIQAHNMASPDDYWSEYRVSMVDQFLYSHPEKMSQKEEMKNQALILFEQRADKMNGEDSKYRPFDQNGYHRTDGWYSRVYSVKGVSSPGNFNIDVVYSSIKNNEVLYKSFTGGKLTFDDINQLGVASGKVSEATDKFVKLWANTGTVDDCLNGIFDGLDQNSDTYWYDCALRYLDFLYVIDVLCGNTYNKLISRYLRNLNRDESDTFITVCAAANAVMDLGDSGRFYVATLPNHYAGVTGKSFEDYQTFSVTGNFVDDPTSPESYSGGIDSFVYTLRDKYFANFRAVNFSTTCGIEGNIRWWWWDSSRNKGAWMCQPTDMNGNTTGNTGYTFLGVPGKEKAPPPYDEKYEDEDPPDDEPDKEDARLKFYISATSDQYEVMKGDTVAAIIDINFKQNEQAIRDFRMLWTANAAKTGDDTPLIGIAIDLDSANEPGNNVVDAVVNNPAHKGEFKTTTTGALLTMRDVDWETALKMFYGREKFTFQDSNITVNEAKERVYVATIGIYWMYPDESFEHVNLYGTGKFKDEDMIYSAYDKVPWTPREDPPNQGHFYSQIRDGNYVEMKDNSPGSGETYEAMAGVPTTENLYAGFGANEFMVNMNCELKSDTGMQRKYTLTYRVSECIGADIPCSRTCDGHPYNVGGCGAVLETDPITGAPTKTCDSGNEVTVYCSDAGPHSLVSTCSCGAKSQTFTEPLGGQCPDNDGTHGCVLTCHANDGHPHVHDFVLTVTQNINGYSYLDIVATDMWQVTKLIVVGNKELFSNPDQEKDPNTGYRAFVSQGPYSSGNGRIVFDWSLPKDTSGARSWGDTKELEEKGGHTLFVAGEAAARNWFTSELSGKKVKANVVSDYITLATTEGYQTITYNDQISQAANVVTDTNWGQKSINCSDVVGGSAQTDYTKNGVPIPFSETRTWMDLWNHEKEASLSNSTMGSYSAQKWESTQITRSGYNGKYDSPTTKWNNTNVFNSSGKDPAEQWKTGSTTFTSENVGRQPNAQFDAHGGFVADGFSNTRMLITGFNIIDSTQKTAGESGVYSADDGVEPVSNGEWNTGNACLLAKRVIHNGDVKGGIPYAEYIDWSAPKAHNYAANGDYYVEVGYTQGKEKINNVVIHNPVAVQNAQIHDSIDLKDDRTASSLSSGGDPVSGSTVAKQWVLDCDEPIVPHGTDCYVYTQSSMKHYGGLNSHEHTEACYTDFSQSLISTGEEQTFNIGKGLYYFEIAGASGKDGDEEGEYGDVVRGTFTVDGDCTVTATIGSESDAYPDGGSSETGTYTNEAGATLSYAAQAAGGGSSKMIISGTDVRIEVKGGRGGRFNVPYTDAYASSFSNNGGGETKANGITVVDKADKSNSGNGYLKLYRAKQSGTSSIDYECYSEGWDVIQENGAGVAVLWQCRTCKATTASMPDSNVKHHKATKTITNYISDPVLSCSNIPNKHVCVTCEEGAIVKKLVCTNPHHYDPNTEEGPAADGSNKFKFHYDPGVGDCYKQVEVGSSGVTDGTEAGAGGSGAGGSADAVVNLDSAFTITYPRTGDFSEAPSMWGILDCTQVRGKGYTDGMDTEQWTRDIYVIFPVDVEDENDDYWTAGTPIPLYHIHNPVSQGDTYTFYCILENREMASGSVQFTSIATNADEVRYYTDNQANTNKERDRVAYAARHTAIQKRKVDIVGFIGALTINDTQDLRFAELFKQVDPSADWLIPGIVHGVFSNVPNKVVTDPENVLHKQNTAPYYGDVFGNGELQSSGTLYSSNGGKHYENPTLPLTPALNPVVALQTEPMRVGYNLLMDVQTVGNYYGINTDGDGNYKDNNMDYKMQITPRYWLLDLKTNKYTPLDVYASFNGSYGLVNSFDGNKSVENYYLYLDWLNESARRNYTGNERSSTLLGQQYFSGLEDSGEVDEDGDPIYIPSTVIKARAPQTDQDVIGTAQRLFLNDLNRTFVGGSYTMGEGHNQADAWYEQEYAIQAQRWHFSMGLPSSSVFVERGKNCNQTNIDAIMKQEDTVVVCTLNILVAGTVWTLEYDGTAINTSVGGGFKIFGDESEFSRVYTPPTEPGTSTPTKDPVVAVYTPNKSAADDLVTSGSH